MPRGPRGETRPAGTVECAVMIARIATGEMDDVKELSGKVRSGKAGAKARAEKLSSAQRREIARTAAAARWGK